MTRLGSLRPWVRVQANGSEMAGKREKARFLHAGHPGVGISDFLIRRSIFGSDEFKGPWMGILL